MIPLTRRHAAGRVGTALVSYSRQGLPRPARLYSTPTKRANAPSLAQATAPSTDYATFMPDASSNSVPSQYSEMESFLRRRPALTILPTPLPDGAYSSLNDFYFTDSPTQDLLSVMDACLHNRYDVPRARQIFARLRQANNPDVVMGTKVYNSFLETYIEMASLTETPSQRQEWLEEAWALFDVMEKGLERVRPDTNTYALAFTAWQKFSKSAPADEPQPSLLRDPAALLRSMIDNEIPVPLVVADRAFKTSEESSEAIKKLSQAAVQMGLSSVVSDLGMADSLGRQGPDALEGVPEAVPVMRIKVSTFIHVEGRSADYGRQKSQDDSTPSSTDDQVDGDKNGTEPDLPFNLLALRKHLAQMVLARRVLTEDNAARQKLLENSVYDVAVARLKHQADLMHELGLGMKGTTSVDLRKWMWDWHQKLQVKLTSEIDKLIESEKGHKSRAILAPFLTILSIEKLSLITILELIHMQGTGGVTDGMKTARALLAVGRAVELEYKADMCKKNNIAVPSNPAGRAGGSSVFSNLGYRALHARRITARKFMEDAEDWIADWTQVIRVRVGSFLVDCLMDVASVTRTAVDRRTGETVSVCFPVYPVHMSSPFTSSEDQPAFFHSYEYLRGHKLGVIKLNPIVAERMAKDAIQETLHPRHLPMLVPPKPWLSHNEGGYFFNKSKL